MKDLVSSLEIYTLHGTNQSEEEEPRFIDIRVGYAYNDDNEMDDSASRQKVAAVTSRLAELGYSGFDDWGDLRRTQDLTFSSLEESKNVSSK